ncbi:MAG: translocation/assembly module TamB, partial [Bacteroidota bacterium]|nr:translocation/assembly module TamB [Bacteroidota bacterium]
DFLAKVKLRNAGFKVVFTQVPYTIEDTEIELKRNFIDLSGIQLKDRRGNLARLTGGIEHKGFQNMNFDLAVQTVSPQMELINTTYKDNQQFYGRAYGSGSFVLLGPQYDMNMFIDVKASSTDSSYITIPPAQTRETGQASFMVEKKYGREMTETERRGGETNMSYEVTLTATPLVNVEVILDELTGDIIRGRGNGTLKLTSGTSAPLRISGRYNIEEGNYLFTFQSVFKRPFIVRKGANNYIEWNGDPYAANIRLDAYYTAENVSFAPLANTLVVDQEASRSLQRIRDDVNVAAILTGDLFAPNIDFRLEFPQNSVAYSQPSIQFALQQLERNKNELTKQVTFLVVTNSFAPYESTQAVARPFEELAYNTISGVLFNVINRELNQILSKVLRNRFTLNLSGSLYNRNLFDPNARGIRLFNQATSNISVGTSLFNGRAILSVGGSFDIPLESNIQQTFQILPDVSLQILLNKTGSLRATVFYRQNVDFLNGFTTSGSPQTRRYGTSLSYSKEFDSFSEFLFGKRKKRRSLFSADSSNQTITISPSANNEQ